MLKVKDTDKTTGLKLSDIKGKAGDDDGRFWSSCQAVVNAAQDMEAKETVKVYPTLLAFLVASTEMQTILKLEVAASQQKGLEEVTVNLAQKKTYCGAGNSKLKPLWTKIKGENIADQSKGNGTTKELATVTDTTKLHKILSYNYTVRKEKQKKTAEQTTKFKKELVYQKREIQRN
uniref:Variant surface glycoprotein n=1 Tax=Trypanosoma brucei TaxID=5691 RepID=A0A1V0FZY0_9TRYP|nr:variant surface glycoprotein [Trypanosoma brucei]